MVERTAGGYGLMKFPYVLGGDFSGLVSAVGPSVDDLRIGDEVFAVCETGHEGAYAEKIAIKAAIVAKKPTSLSQSRIGIYPLIATCTLWQSTMRTLH
jgi:NADPH:quinone reductase-like Zn-dependent oxidoreductase